jgi:phage minor structural protein
MCFLRDTINRPYNYQATPRSCFVTLINQHNSAADEWKRFEVGNVTVTDPNEWIKLDSESAETTLATLNKLLDRCGGYIVFTNNPVTGQRVIHWLAKLDQKSTQTVEFGENLLDFSSTGANTTSLATGLIPYGAKDEKTKKRITIESVNNGRDYILANDAVAVRGIILASKTWDDVTSPSALLSKARAYLNENKLFITSLELTALDLSYLDKELDSFSVGDTIRVVSAPHAVNDDFQLSQMTEDFLSPTKSKIVLGKDIPSLTGAGVASDFQSQAALEGVKVNYNTDTEAVAATVEASVIAKIGDIYVTQDTAAGLANRIEAEEQARADADAALQGSINAEANTRAGIINKVSGVVHISGGAPIKMLGGKVEIDGTEIHFGKEARFLNGSGIRIADKDGNFYYVLRVDEANSCVVGNDYTNLYLRGKDAVYLYKTGAVVTSDRRHKNSAEALPEAYEAMLDKLTPMRFRYNDRGDKYHVGFVAQDVKAALEEVGLSTDEFGGFVDLNGDGSELGLAYDEFIGLLLQKIRKLEKRLDDMEGLRNE